MKKFLVALIVVLLLSMNNITSAEKFSDSQLKAILNDFATTSVEKSLPITFEQFKETFNSNMLNSFESSKRNEIPEDVLNAILLNNVKLERVEKDNLFVKPFISGEVALLGMSDVSTNKMKKLTFFFVEPQTENDKTFNGLVVLCLLKSVLPNADVNILANELAAEKVVVREGVRLELGRDSQIFILTITAA